MKIYLNKGFLLVINNFLDLIIEIKLFLQQIWPNNWSITSQDQLQRAYCIKKVDFTLEKLTSILIFSTVSIDFRAEMSKKLRLKL